MKDLYIYVSTLGGNCFSLGTLPATTLQPLKSALRHHAAPGSCRICVEGEQAKVLLVRDVPFKALDSIGAALTALAANAH